jgi:hypothetical protein
MIDEPRPKGFSSCLWCDLRFNIRCSYYPGSENELIDIESFLDDGTRAGKLPLIQLLFLMLEVLPPTFFPPRQSFSRIY